MYIYIITGKEMKLDLGTQSFMQNTFTIFSLTILNVLTFYVYICLGLMSKWRSFWMMLLLFNNKHK